MIYIIKTIVTIPSNRLTTKKNMKKTKKNKKMKKVDRTIDCTITDFSDILNESGDEDHMPPYRGRRRNIDNQQ